MTHTQTRITQCYNSGKKNARLRSFNVSLFSLSNRMDNPHNVCIFNLTVATVCTMHSMQGYKYMCVCVQGTRFATSRMDMK